MQTFSINDIPEFSKKERVVAVGVIGKSPFRYPNKTTPLLPAVEVEETGIQCHWDERRGVLFLHAVTYLDTVQLAKLAANLDENSKSTDKDADAAHWLVASGELAADSCKAMALLFQLCHIVVLSSPTSVFDIGYLQLFKAISSYRTELLPRITEALTAINVTGAWETHQRTCCPRLLFHFRRAPRQLKRNLAGLKRLEHSVEDQLYYILRKARIITNVCAESLFAIPKNEEFVYISAEEGEGCARDVSALVRGLVLMCEGAPSDAGLDRPGFNQFLQGHIDLAFGDGFDDNVGKYAMSNSFFELPSASSWRSAAQALCPVYLEPPSEGATSDEAPSDEAPATGALYDALATDVRFSQARCAKVLPIAQASYAEGLPSHYSSQHHAHKVKVALGVLAGMARGPLAAAARRRLQGACRAAWSARRLCEAPSLTHQPCILPHHEGAGEHSSGVRYVCACNCGRTRTPRADPYTPRAANHAHYALAARDCAHCPDLRAHVFPVFTPSTTTYRAAAVRGEGEGSQEEEEQWGSQASGDPAWWAPDVLSPPSDEHTPDNNDKYELVPVTEDTASEKVITRQPSTTEYLPGMLHTASPEGLLPAYAHWSLVCLGPSSLYSHSMGLSEHLQPGLLPHTNYLMPWDAAVRMEQPSAWRGGRGRGGRGAQLTVKIFIGFEYECLRGHRWMNTDGAADGAALSRRSLPVWAPCVCRADQPATLTRLHVVTPKAQLNVTIYPKVQPVAGGPTFILGPSPIPLSGSAYWILRLPFVYAWERGVLPRPRGPVKQGILHAPVFGLKQ